MATYFTDAGSGNDANDGLDNIGVALATATWTESTLTLTEAAHGYTFATGDVIYIASGTGVSQTGLYEVASSTSSTIVLAATSALPGIQDANDFAAGDLATGDIVSASGPLLTLNAAEDQPVVGGDHVWARSGTSYTETLTLDVSGSADISLITYEGYTTTLGDTGRAVIDGASTRTTCITGSGRDWRQFKNIEMKLATADLVSLSITSDKNTWKNCYFHDSVDGIVSYNDYFTFERCIFENFTGSACHGNRDVQILSCVFKNCTGTAVVRAENAFVFDSLFYDVGTTTKAVWLDFIGSCIIAHNTFYGSKTTSDYAIHVSSGSMTTLSIFNNLITHWTAGINVVDDWTNGWVAGFNNLLFDNTSDYLVSDSATTGKLTFSGEVTTDPGLVNPGTDDYTFTSGSPAVGAGITGFDADGTPSNVSIGAFTVAGSGGGGPSKLVGEGGGLIG